MLSLYALLFFALGSSVVALPVTNPIAKLQRLLEDHGCAGPTAWFGIENPDKDSPEHVNQVIEFAPDKFPRMGTLLKDGEFSKGEFIMGNLNEILQKIQGTWGLMPNNTNMNKRLYELNIEPDPTTKVEEQAMKLEVNKPLPTRIIRTQVVARYDYNVDHVIPRRMVGRWYRIPMAMHEDAIQNHGNINPEDHPNDVIELHNDNEEGQRLKITWYELGPGGKINRIVVNPEQVRSRLRGTWGRLPENDNNVYVYDKLSIFESTPGLLKLLVYGVSEYHTR